MRQETFVDETAARAFGDLVDRVGPEAALAVKEARQNRGDVPTFNEWTTTYLSESEGYLTGIQVRTRNGYRMIAENSLNPILGEIPIDAITRTDIGRWVAWQEAQPSRRSGSSGTVAAKTMRNYHGLLSSILAASVEAKYRTDNPARGIRMSRGQKREAVFLAREESATLLHFAAAYYRPVMLFFVGTGARWSEATALQKRDVNTDTTPSTVRIVKAWKKGNTIGPPKSERSKRTISLWPEIVTQLNLDGEPDDFLFQPGRPPGQARSDVTYPCISPVGCSVPAGL